jgi:flagellar assembly protein FliH
MSKIIRAEDLAGAVATWGPPVVEGGASAQRKGGTVTAGVLEDLQQEAYREAYEQGMREGTAAGREQVKSQVARLDRLFASLATPLADLEDGVQRELVALAMALARQILRRELKQDPTQIIGIVREAIAQLPIAARDVRIQLHPQDAAIVRENLAPAEQERAWTLVEDPMMTRGGCQVITATSRIDVRLETRLMALLAELMGGERDVESGRAGERG